MRGVSGVVNATAEDGPKQHFRLGIRRQVDRILRKAAPVLVEPLNEDVRPGHPGGHLTGDVALMAPVFEKRVKKGQFHIHIMGDAGDVGN